LSDQNHPTLDRLRDVYLQTRDARDLMAAVLAELASEREDGSAYTIDRACDSLAVVLGQLAVMRQEVFTVLTDLGPILEDDSEG